MFTVTVHIRYASRKYNLVQKMFDTQFDKKVFDTLCGKWQMCSFSSFASVVSYSVSVTDRDLLKHEHKTVTLLKNFFNTETQLNKVYGINTANYQSQKHPPSADGVTTHLSKTALISSSPP